MGTLAGNLPGRFPCATLRGYCRRRDIQLQESDGVMYQLDERRVRADGDYFVAERSNRCADSTSECNARDTAVRSGDDPAEGGCTAPH